MPDVYFLCGRDLYDDFYESGRRDQRQVRIFREKDRKLSAYHREPSIGLVPEEL